MIQANNQHRARLLLLDEDRIVRQSLARLLQQSGYDVRTADNITDAVHELETGTIDVLLGDINQHAARVPDKRT